MDNLPPPHEDCSKDDVPDYYLGKLIVHEPLASDACKWVVYDGNSKVRCVSRASAIDYINSRNYGMNKESIRLTARARYHCNKACNLLQDAASYAGSEDRLLLEYISVQFKPILVMVDNFLIAKNNEQLPNNENQCSPGDGAA